MTSRDERLHLRRLEARERDTLMERMKRAGRQTHSMKRLRLGGVYIAEVGRSIAGWGGFDFQSNRRYPEFFSLFVYPDFRGQGIALALELVRYREAQAQGARHAYIRVGSEVSPELTRKRLESGCFRFVEVDGSFSELCSDCPQNGSSCATQQFMVIDVEKRAAQIVSGGQRLPPPPTVPGGVTAG
jgi:GNAT superfamily N-acetyltransferase